MKKYVIDTNVLIDYPNALNKYKKVILPLTVLEELDKLKQVRGLEQRAREACRAIERAGNVVKDVRELYCFPEGLDSKKSDNLILMCAKENNATMVSNDLSVKAKAESMGIPCEGFEPLEYKGFIRVRGTTKQINKFFNSKKFGEMHINQYLIIENTETNEVEEMVMDVGGLRGLYLPSHNIIRGWNSEQRCALDLLNNKVPIKLILGIAGSGKTKLAVEMGVHQVMETCKFNDLVLVRNPIGSGEDIGFLPGGFEEKMSEFYAPIIENIDGGDEIVELMLTRERLHKKIPFHIKGRTFNNSFILVDEAEDLDVKTLKLIGTRVGKNSCIVFSGDYKQAEGKFMNNNGLLKLIDSVKGNPMVGIVVLETDVRSGASAIFAEVI